MDRLHETGGTLYYLQMLPRLDPARVAPFLCVFAPWHPIAERFEAAGIQPTFFGRARWDPRCVLDLVRFARGCNADLLHLEGWTSFPFGRLGAHLTRRPAMLRFNNMLPIPRIKALFNHRLTSSTWPAVAVSEAVRAWAIQEFKIPPAQVALLYSGHEIERFASPSPGARDRMRREFDLPHNAPVIGLVGRLDFAQKGQDVMIRAMSAVRVHRPDAVLLLVGDGPDRARCDALICKLGLDHAVRIAGHRYDVADILAAVDIAVVTSMCEEALGFVALEASAAGLPVIAFRSGGLPEVILHEQTGIIVPKGSTDDLARAVATVLGDPDLAGRLGEAGRKHASRFGLSEHVGQVMEFCEAVVDEHRRREHRRTVPEEPTS